MAHAREGWISTLPALRLTRSSRASPFAGSLDLDRDTDVPVSLHKVPLVWTETTVLG
jgi:hypothetical protein